MNEDDLFAEEMAGVKPLGRDARVRLVKERLSEDQQLDRRRAFLPPPEDLPRLRPAATSPRMAQTDAEGREAQSGERSCHPHQS